MTARPLAFPEAQSFWDIFEAAGPYRNTDPAKAHLTPAEWPLIRTANGFVVGSYLSISGYHVPYSSLRVRPRPEVVEYIKANMLPIEHDRIFFKATVRASGEVLLTADYNSIIGSRWLAVVGSVPELDEITEGATSDERRVAAANRNHDVAARRNRRRGA